MTSSTEPNKSADEQIVRVSSRFPDADRIKWSDSLVVRTAMAVTAIMVLGYFASIFIAVDRIKFISRVTMKLDASEQLSDYMELLKTSHKTKQDLALERVAKIIESDFGGAGAGSFGKGSVEKIVAKAELAQLFGVEGIRVEGGAATVKDAEWEGPESLNLGRWVVQFDQGETFTRFKRAESLRQEAQILRASLQEDILPAVIRSAVFVLLIMFLVLIATFFALAKRFSGLVDRITSGMKYWSETDENFRFDQSWKGEFGLITTRFNAMADEVSENRRRSMFLEKIASWQTIARKLAHEIKNPLTPIQMMVAQMVRRYKGDDPDYKSLLEKAERVIGEEISGLGRMVDSFSQFARLPDPRLHQTDIAGVLERVVELEKAAFSQHDISLKTPVKSLPVVADDDLLRQVIINLVKNAAEACGPQKGRIVCHLQDLGSYYQIIIEDDGPGIPEDVQKRLFEAYFTTKHTGPNPGMGLGLAVCQKIVMDHGGRIKVESQPGRTQFLLIMPKDGGGERHGG